jgi:hypothetical protein
MAPCMTSILALSVTDKIEQYGAYAGFASVLGLAVLSLLYFAQAREVKRLREWAGRAPERAADLQDRVQGAAAQRVVPTPAAAPRPVGAQPVAVPGAAARPAAATPAGQAQGLPGAAAAPAAAGAATAAGAAAAAPTPATPGAVNPGTGQPTTVQPAANGAPPAPAVPAPKPGTPLRVPPSATPPRTPPAEPDEPGRSIWAILAAAAALVVVGLVLVFVVFGGDDDKQAANTIGTPGLSTSTSSSTASSTTTKSGTPSATPKPGTYTVAVLNGTAVPGLARGVANRLQNTKFKIGNVTNAADQTRSATLVEYAAGHLAEAQAVAKAIDVGKDAIQAVDSGSRAIAGEQASVVVIVGSDQNTSPQSTP